MDDTSEITIAKALFYQRLSAVLSTVPDADASLSKQCAAIQFLKSRKMIFDYVGVEVIGEGGNRGGQFL